MSNYWYSCIGGKTSKERGRKSQWARARGRMSQGANKPEGERARGWKSQGANKPGGKPAKGRKSQTPCRNRGAQTSTLRYTLVPHPWSRSVSQSGEALVSGCKKMKWRSELHCAACDRVYMPCWCCIILRYRRLLYTAQKCAKTSLNSTCWLFVPIAAEFTF